MCTSTCEGEEDFAIIGFMDGILKSFLLVIFVLVTVAVALTSFCVMLSCFVSARERRLLTAAEEERERAASE